MSDYRELLIGCGHARDKRLSLDGSTAWRGLITLDCNGMCDPDLICNLDTLSKWYVANNADEHRRRWELNQTDIVNESGLMIADSFDEVHAYEVLEHLGQQGDSHAFFHHFAEIWRILKPDGHLYATVPSRFSPWLWGDPSHRRAILPESLVFLDQSEYTKQLDGPRKTPMSDFRNIWQADFHCVQKADNRETFAFVLRAVKPSRFKARGA